MPGNPLVHSVEPCVKSMNVQIGCRVAVDRREHDFLNPHR